MMKEVFKKAKMYPETWFWCFMVFSLAGWLYEVVVFAFEYHQGFINRGFLFGPYLPVYGSGMILVLLTLLGVKQKKIGTGKINLMPILMFFLIIFITTVTELITSYILEIFTGGNGFLWDYSGLNYGPHFEGRISVVSSLRFGIMGMVGLYIVQPITSFVVDKLRGLKKGKVVFYGATILMIIIFLVDVVIHIGQSVIKYF